jgi:hypothetical protein
MSSDAPEGAPTTGGVPRALVWVLAGAAVLALVATVVTGVLAHSRKGSALGGLSPREQNAITAARTEMLRVQTFRRASFDADIDAALAGMTPEQGKQITDGKKDLLDALTKNKFDTTAQINSAGLISINADSAEVVLAVNSLQTDDKGTLLNSKPGAFQMSLVFTNNKWLMSNLKPVTFG